MLERFVKMTVMVAAGELLRLVGEHDGSLPVCLDKGKAGAELLGNMLPAGSTLVATVENIKVPHAAPYVRLSVGLQVWLDDGDGSNGTPATFMERSGREAVRHMIAVAAAERATVEGGLKLHPLEA